MYCLVILTWSLSMERKCARACVLVLTCSFTRCSKYNTACFDCLRTVHAYFSSVLPFTTINKWFNAEVTWIPKESSLLQSHTFVVFFCSFRCCLVFFPTLLLFTLWHAIAILIVFFTLYALFAYFTFISCFGKLNTRHQSNVCAVCCCCYSNSINRQILTNNIFFTVSILNAMHFIWSRHFNFSVGFFPLFFSNGKIGLASFM